MSNKHTKSHRRTAYLPSVMMTLPAVLVSSGLTTSRLFHLIRKGKFPAPIHLCRKYMVWDFFAVEGWMPPREQSDKR